MLKSFYGLRAEPFPLSPDQAQAFEHAHFVKARDYVDYALLQGDGIVMITGLPGTGKSTLVNALQGRIDPGQARVLVVMTTQLEADDLLRLLVAELGGSAALASKALLLQETRRRLQDSAAQGRRTLLIVDEAQDLPVGALEELRLLTNLQHAGTPLLQVLLVGQPQLRERVRQPGMEQLHQRIVAAWQLRPLSPNETVAYVAHRLRLAGWTGRPSFERGVLASVYAFSGGVPRLINLICTRLMLRGAVTGSGSISAEDAEVVTAELREEALTPGDRGTAETTGDPDPVLLEPLAAPERKGAADADASPSSDAPAPACAPNGASGREDAHSPDAAEPVLATPAVELWEADREPEPAAELEPEPELEPDSAGAVVGADALVAAAGKRGAMGRYGAALMLLVLLGGGLYLADPARWASVSGFHGPATGHTAASAAQGPTLGASAQSRSLPEAAPLEGSAAERSFARADDTAPQAIDRGGGGSGD